MGALKNLANDFVVVLFFWFQHESGAGIAPVPAAKKVKVSSPTNKDANGKADDDGAGEEKEKGSKEDAQKRRPFH